MHQSGINALGNGIGHDILLTMDDNTEKAMVLNSYFNPDMDTYQSGSIELPLGEMVYGFHTLVLKAWDLQNNSSSSTLEFIIARNLDLAVSELMNYPNPVVNSTSFSFVHNQFNSDLSVSINIFNMAGSLVRSIGPQLVNSNGYEIEPIVWDGKGLSGQHLGSGVYIYRLTIDNNVNSITELSGKLIIIE